MLKNTKSFQYISKHWHIFLFNSREEIQYPALPHCCHGNTSGRHFILLLWSSSCKQRKEKQHGLLYFLLVEIQWKINIQGKKITYLQRT